MRKGAVLILSMIFVVVFSTLAVSMASFSGTNVQVASNQHQLALAMASAESGLEVMRYWLTRVTIPNETEPSNYLSTIVSSIRNDLAANNISNITVDQNGSIAPVTLGTTTGQTFAGYMVVQPDQPNILEVYATGGNGRFMHTIKVCYEIGPDRNPLFEYGIVTKGPLHMRGSMEVGGLNHGNEADVYIVSANNNIALSMKGTSSVTGDVHIVNSSAKASLSSSVSVGGENGRDAINHRVTIGAPEIDFPVLDIGALESYAVNTFDPDTDTSNNMTLENIRIPANTNPNFSGNVIMEGIVFIESPNIVSFTGNADITGIIIGDGSLVDVPSDENQIIFRGNVASHSVSELDAGFGDVRHETGTFLLAPGFSTSFGGSFETLSGVIAANGVEFFGNAGGTINGSVINYGQPPMSLSASTALVIDRFGGQEIPAGFEYVIVLHYNPTSYTDIAR
jgi:hypothetical protein